MKVFGKLPPAEKKMLGVYLYTVSILCAMLMSDVKVLFMYFALYVVIVSSRIVFTKLRIVLYTVSF